MAWWQALLAAWAGSLVGWLAGAWWVADGIQREAARLEDLPTWYYTLQARLYGYPERWGLTLICRLCAGPVQWHGPRQEWVHSAEGTEYDHGLWHAVEVGVANRIPYDEQPGL